MTSESKTYFLLPAWTLLHREVRLFLRQPSRIVAALGTPLLFWALIGSGIGTSFRPPGAPEGSGFLQYFFPGTVALVVLFTAIFSTISIIQDRQAGFLQGVLVAPVAPGAVALGKILGGTVLAVLQGTLLLLAAPWLGFSLTPVSFVGSILALAGMGFGLTAIGFFFAWRMDSIQGFHGVMNLLLFPMWLLSGALFPPSGSARWIRLAMRLNPLAYGLAAFRHTLSGGAAPAGTIPSLPLSAGVVVGFGVAMYGLAAWSTRRGTSR